MFRDWFLDAEESPSVSEANAMAISTVEEDDLPENQNGFCLRLILGKVLFFTPIMIAKKGKPSKK